MTQNSAHSIVLEVGGSQLPLLENVIKQIRLSDSVSRVRIEVESDEPFLNQEKVQAVSDVLGGKSNLTNGKSAEKPVETPPEPDEAEPDEAEEFVCGGCGKTFEKKQGLKVHQGQWCDKAEKGDDQPPESVVDCPNCSEVFETIGDMKAHVAEDHPENKNGEHVTDALVRPTTDDPDGEREDDPGFEINHEDLRIDESDGGKVMTGKAAKNYLDNFDLPNGEVPKPEEFKAVLEEPLKPDTQKWYIAALLYRTQGLMDANSIVRRLRGSDWEIPDTSIHVPAQALVAGGYAYKVKKNKKIHYQLTQLGRDYVESLASHTPGYIMAVADKITKSERLENVQKAEV